MSVLIVQLYLGGTKNSKEQFSFWISQREQKGHENQLQRQTSDISPN